MLSNYEDGKTVSSGDYDEVFLNTRLKRAGLNPVGGSNKKPDVIGIKNKIVEVVSAKQSIKSVENKVKAIKNVNIGLDTKTIKILRKINIFFCGK